jgi:hypothetical protein
VSLMSLLCLLSCSLAFFVDGVCSLSCSFSFSVGPGGSVSGARSVYRLGFWLLFDPIYSRALHTSLIVRHFPSVSSFGVFSRQVMSPWLSIYRIVTTPLFLVSRCVCIERDAFERPTSDIYL